MTKQTKETRTDRQRAPWPYPVALIAAAIAAANPNQPLDRPFTLRNPSPFLVEAEFHRMAAGTAPRTFILPRPCFSEGDSSRVCSEGGGWRYEDSLRARALRVSPLGGYEYRYWGENVHAFELGLITDGRSGPVSFALDARMFSESHELPVHPSFDREAVDEQDETESGSVSYSSYARYRANLSYDWAWGRLSAGRDAAHWGPGMFGNLVFNQGAVPFNQITFTTRLGPITVQSLYGQLAIGSDWETNLSTDERHLYAHRYEWQPATNLLLGVSEQLVLFKQSAPFAFMPIVPLFIAKYSEKERLNNGNIAADLSWRVPGIGSAYTEFLIDDLQSPGSLFSDFWANKWAWLAGVHAIRDLPFAACGAILEYARVEPWVYTHYRENTSQTLNFDQPLGNQDGPNSQSVTAKAYARGKSGWYAGLKARALWKGTGPGSSALDIHPDTLDKKVFLSGDPDAEITAGPSLSWTGKRFTLYLEATLGGVDRVVAGAQARY